MVTLLFKTPDVLDQLNKRDFDSQEEYEEALEFIRNYLKFSEYIEVEFDIKNQKVTVKRVK